jgi:hypothetical protein
MADFTGNPLFLVGGSITAPDTGDNIVFDANNFSLDVSGNVTVTGNLVVQGTTVTANAQDLIVGDDYLTLNSGYTSMMDAQSGIVSVLRAGNISFNISQLESQATTGGLAKITLTTNNSADLSFTFDVDYVIQISGTESNDGLYMVNTVTGGTPDTLEISSSPANDFAGGDFTDETPASGTVNVVDVSVLRTAMGAGSGYEYGSLASASASQTGSISYTSLSGGGGSTPTFDTVFLAGLSESDRNGLTARDYYAGTGITFPLNLEFSNGDTGWGVALKMKTGSSISTRMSNSNNDTATYYLVAGENISKGDVVAIKNDGSGNAKLYVADNTTSNGKTEVVGMAVEDASSGGFVHMICIQGQLAYSNTDTSAFLATTVGAPLYLGATGDVTSTAPTVSGSTVVRVGYLVQRYDVANSIETTLFFSPQTIGVNN